MNEATATTPMDNHTPVSVESLVYELINGEPGTYGPSISLVVKDLCGRFEGAVLFTDFYKDYGRAEIHMAGLREGWVTPNLVYYIMKTALNLKLRMVTAKTTPDNKSVIRLMMAAGACRYTIKDMRGNGKDEVLLTLTMQDMLKTNFWRKINGRKNTKSA